MPAEAAVPMPKVKYVSATMATMAMAALPTPPRT